MHSCYNYNKVKIKESISMVPGNVIGGYEGTKGERKKWASVEKGATYSFMVRTRKQC